MASNIRHSVGGRDLPSNFSMMEITKKKLLEKAEILLKDGNDILRAAGEEAIDGDADDDITLFNAHQDEMTKRGEAIFNKFCAAKAEIITKPQDNEHIQIGHMVEINFEENPPSNLKAEALYHIMGPLDTSILNTITREPDSRYEEETVISNASPLGEALIGLTAGSIVKWTANNRNFSCKIGSNPDSILPSSFFELSEI